MENKELDRNRIDRLIHEPARLMITTILRHVEEAEFTFLLRETKLTNGNLVSHLRRMEEAGYVSVAKAFKGRKPCTTYRMTPRGTARYDAYRKQLGEILGGPYPSTSPGSSSG